MQLSNLRLGTKLGAAFVIVVALTAAVGAFSVAQLGVVNASTAVLATDSLPSIEAVARMSATANQFRRAEADHVLSIDPQEMATIEQRFTELKQTLVKQQSDYATLLSSDKERAEHAKLKNDTALFFTTHDKLVALSKGGEKTLAETKTLFRTDARTGFRELIADLDRLGETNQKTAETAYATAQATFSRTRTGVVAMVLGLIVIAAALAWWITRLITRPVIAAAAAARRIAEGDLTVTLDIRGKDETAQLLQALDAMKGNLAGIVSGVRANADSVATASSQIAQGNQDLSQRTEQQASALQQTAASMEELNATVKQNADNARQANQLAQSASGVAVKGGDVVGQVVDTMKGINDSSRKIADIISVIDGIAFQTNILALNAAVEAARAGEQGRGFAVVATEVRSLAQRSAAAAKEIKGLISASVERVACGTTLVDQAGVTMAEVVSSIRRVTDIMGEISAASAEQSTGVAQVGEAIGQMDQVTQQNAALVEQSAAAAESLKSQAGALVTAVSVFRLNATMPLSASTSPRKAESKPSPVVAAVPPAADRRGPNRATNVTRPDFKSKAAAVAPTAAAPTTAPAAAAARTGTDDWEAF